MANYTAADVKKLRELTGSGMMDCKNALVDTDGNFDAAVDLLRIKGAKDVGKRATRSTSNGLVAIRDGLALELACETDFVAKNADFQALGDQIVDAALAGKADDAQAALGLSIGAQTVAEAIHDVSAKIGEKIELRRLARIEGNTSAYLHRKSADLPPQVGVLVGFTGNDADAARSVGMQIAAMKPRFVTRDEVPADVVEKERQIAETKFREEGKPEQAIAKIAEGVINKYYKENVLLEQESVQDSKKSVKQILEGTGVIVTRFVRYEVGQE